MYKRQRVLKPGGVFATWCYLVQLIDNHEYPDVVELVQRIYFELVHEYWAKERKHLEQGYANIDIPLELIEAPTYHIQIHWDLDELCGYVNTWSACRAYKEQKGQFPTETLVAEFRKAWPDPKQKRSFAWPMPLRAGRLK